MSRSDGDAFILRGVTDPNEPLELEAIELRLLGEGREGPSDRDLRQRSDPFDEG